MVSGRRNYYAGVLCLEPAPLVEYCNGSPFSARGCSGKSVTRCALSTLLSITSSIQLSYIGSGYMHIVQVSI